MTLLSNLAFFLRHFDDDVRQPPLITIRAPHRRRPDPLHARPLVYVRFRYDQLVDVDVFKPVLRVSDRRLQHLLHRRRDPLVGRPQRVQRRARVLSADQVDDQPRLLRRNSNVACFRFGFHDSLYAGLAVFSVVAAFTEWPLKVRVGENSPSLCPTMFSVTYTGMNFLPLCTAIVWPTNSGRIVERRDQVRTTFFSFDVLSTATFVSRCVSVNGPFLTERPISLRKKSKS